MTPLRAVGVALLSVVDALVPSTLVALAVLTLRAESTGGAWSPYALAAGAGGLVFVVTIGVGFALTIAGIGPFPVTRAVKRVWQWWNRPWFR